MKNFLDLPVEVISLILGQLEDMGDRVALAEAHPILANGFAHYASIFHQTIKCSEMPFSYWSKVLHLSGEYVTSIKLVNAVYAVAMLKLACDHCPNLDEISFPIRCEYWAVIVPMLLSLKKLTKIGLRNDSRKVNFINTLHKVPHLNKLFLAGFNNDDLYRVEELICLKSLQIVNTEPLDIYLFFFPLKNLENLDVKYADINFPLCREGKQFWPQMKTMNFTYAFFYSEMAYFPKLKQLGIGQIHPHIKIAEMFGRSLSKYGNTLRALGLVKENPPNEADDAKAISELKQLRNLFLPCINNQFIGCLKLEKLREMFLPESIKVTNAGILQLLRGCEKLRVIDFFGCMDVNKHVVQPALKIMKKNGIRRNRPLELRVNREFGDHISFLELKALAIRRPIGRRRV